MDDFKVSERCEKHYSWYCECVTLEASQRVPRRALHGTVDRTFLDYLILAFPISAVLLLVIFAVRGYWDGYQAEVNRIESQIRQQKQIAKESLREIDTMIRDAEEQERLIQVRKRAAEMTSAELEKALRDAKKKVTTY